MKIAAVKVTKIEDGYTYYQEIDRKTGRVMIEDYMPCDRFNKACLSDNGFVLLNGFTSEGKLWAVTRELKASLEVMTLVPIWEDMPDGSSHYIGHMKRNIRYSEETGDYYQVGRRSVDFVKL